MKMDIREPLQEKLENIFLILLISYRGLDIRE